MAAVTDSEISQDESSIGVFIKEEMLDEEEESIVDPVDSNHSITDNSDPVPNTAVQVKTETKDTFAPVITQVASIDPLQFSDEDGDHGEKGGLREAEPYRAVDENVHSRCAYCPYRAMTASLVTLHIQHSHICSFCKKFFSKPVELNLHKKLHQNEKLQAGLFPCRFCAQIFASQALLFGHVQSLHPDRITRIQMLPNGKVKSIGIEAFSTTSSPTEKQLSMLKSLKPVLPDGKWVDAGKKLPPVPVKLPPAPGIVSSLLRRKTSQQPPIIIRKRSPNVFCPAPKVVTSQSIGGNVGGGTSNTFLTLGSTSITTARANNKEPAKKRKKFFLVTKKNGQKSLIEMLEPNQLPTRLLEPGAAARKVAVRRPGVLSVPRTMLAGAAGGVNFTHNSTRRLLPKPTAQLAQNLAQLRPETSFESLRKTLESVDMAAESSSNRVPDLNVELDKLLESFEAEDPDSGSSAGQVGGGVVIKTELNQLLDTLGVGDDKVTPEWKSDSLCAEDPEMGSSDGKSGGVVIKAELNHLLDNLADVETDREVGLNFVKINSLLECSGKSENVSNANLSSDESSNMSKNINPGTELNRLKLKKITSLLENGGVKVGTGSSVESKLASSASAKTILMKDIGVFRGSQEEVHPVTESKAEKLDINPKKRKLSLETPPVVMAQEEAVACRRSKRRRIQRRFSNSEETADLTETPGPCAAKPPTSRLTKERVDAGESDPAVPPSEKDESPKSKKKRQAIREYFVLAQNKNVDIQKLQNKTTDEGGDADKGKRKSGRKRGGAVQGKQPKSPEVLVGSELLSRKTDTKPQQQGKRRKSVVEPEPQTKKKSEGKTERQRPVVIDPKLNLIPDENPYAKRAKSFRRRRPINNDDEKEDKRSDNDNVIMDIARERKENICLRLLEPYCNICQLLMDPAETGKLATEVDPGKRIPVNSVVWIPQAAAQIEDNRNKDDASAANDNSFPVSRLLVCSSCEVCVHAACYMADSNAAEADDWLCDRCIHVASRDNDSPVCGLCQKGGGVLRRTNARANSSTGSSSQFLHVRCAVLVPECRAVAWHRVDTEEIVPKKRWTMPCLICGVAGREPAVHCMASRECMLSLHPSCAIAARVDCAVGPNNSVIIRCNFCLDKFNLKVEEAAAQVSKFQAQDIEVGERVEIVDNEGMSGGVVVKVTPEEFCSAAFDDGTFCDALEPSCVRGIGPTADRPLEENLPVEISWEGGVYTGIFRGRNTLLWYHVKVDDHGEELYELDRTDLVKL